MALIDFLTQTALIEAESPPAQQVPQDALGGADRRDWTTVASDVPCLFRSRSVTLAAFAGRRNDSRQPTTDARIYFASDPIAEGLTSKHRITVSGCPRPSDNGTYAVVGAIDPNALGRLLEVDCERVRFP